MKIKIGDKLPLAEYFYLDQDNIVKKIESIILNARTTPSLEKFKIKALDN